MRSAILSVLFLLLLVFFVVPIENGNTIFEIIKSGGKYESPLEKEVGISGEVTLPKKTKEETSFGGVLKEENVDDTQEPATEEENVSEIDTDQNEQILSEGIKNPKDASPSPKSYVDLSVHGILEWTNYYRVKNGLKPLERNLLLVSAAKLKVEDMFRHQYFEHIAPDGTDIADIAREVGYQYIAVGENLALGGFESSKDLVDAWMESPGHRANILNKGYDEIGISLRYGTFKGQGVWLSVQEFGRPRSSCPIPNQDLKEKIDQNKEKIDEFSDRLEKIRVELEEMKEGSAEAYNEKVERYNTLAKKINTINEELKEFIATYNSQVNNFNVCAEN